MLHATTYAPARRADEDDRRRVVLVHGFSQTGASWEPIARQLADLGLDVICPDVAGHGGSATVLADLWRGAELVAEVAGRAAYVGYSMGGRLALHVALSYPSVVERLVLLGATAGLESEAERSSRRTADEALADGLERDGLEEFLNHWLASPLFATLDPTPADLAARRANTVGGLASSLRLAGTGAQSSLWERLGELTMPVLLLAGERDEKFRLVAARMAAAIGPNAVASSVPDAGHAAHLEQPTAFLDAMRPFLLTQPR